MTRLCDILQIYLFVFIFHIELIRHIPTIVDHGRSTINLPLSLPELILRQCFYHLVIYFQYERVRKIFVLHFFTI